MKALLFLKPADEAEVRIASFTHKFNGASQVLVRTLLGVEHEPCSPTFDAVRLDLKTLLAMGITEVRLEVEA